MSFVKRPLLGSVKRPEVGTKHLGELFYWDSELFWLPFVLFHFVECFSERLFTLVLLKVIYCGLTCRDFCYMYIY